MAGKSTFRYRKYFSLPRPSRFVPELPTSEGVIVNRSKAYDTCKVDERSEWVDIFVALIQYLLSGESKVGSLNNSHPRNLIHKVSPVQHN
jgi:hypothetical protein